MKKICYLLVSILVLSVASCTQKKEKENLKDMHLSDSLQHIVDLRDAEINDLLTVFNDVQQSFNEINEAEDRIILAKNGERGNSAAVIRENFNFIKEKMRQNREQIEQLEQKLRESTFKGDEMKRSLESLVAQLKKKDKEMAELALLIEEKNTTIAALDEHIQAQSTRITQQENTISEQNQNITSLNNKVDEQAAENTRKQETIDAQVKSMNTAFYVFGTKAELKEQGILDGGKVLNGNFNKSYFTQIDIRNMKEVKLYSKKAELLTSHPAGTYTLQKDMNDQLILKITDPQRFWSASKYLVVQVK
ncbi:MAG: hypothetical protein MJZ32_09075 [Bacteroidaceae bacterium]|nr:hypothetical protein [Bacteroidaceae bacterium]